MVNLGITTMIISALMVIVGMSIFGANLVPQSLSEFIYGIACLALYIYGNLNKTKTIKLW